MKAFLSAVIAALLIGFGAYAVLESNQQTATAKFSTSNVRN